MNEELRFDSVLTASQKSAALVKYKSQMNSGTNIGSGIPLIEINED
jgi:hypothetical protein